MMLKRMFVATFLLVLVASPAVSNAAEVRVDYDKHKDFGQYRTFTIEIGPLVRADGVLDEQNTIAEDRLRQAAKREFIARGLEPAEEGADLVVRASNRESERTSIVTTGWNGYPWYGWGYRRWGHRSLYRYGGWPYSGNVWTRRYVEGTLTVDVVERDSGALVYRAQVTDEVSKNVDKQVTKAMDKALKKFPVKELSN